MVRVKTPLRIARCLPVIACAALLLALIAIACDPGATVKYVNDTERVVFVEVSDGGEMRIEPHSSIRRSDLGVDDDPYIVTVRDEEGNILYHEETTFGEVKKRNRPIVIEEPTPPPAPSPTPS